MVDLPAVFGEVAADLLKPFGTAAIKSYLKRRADEARAILIEEIRKSRINAAKAASEDDALAAMFRFERAVREGTARLNLRLMAKVLAGQLQLNKLVADDFMLFADSLAALSREEIIVIAKMLKAHRARQENPSLPAAIEGEAASPWSDVRVALATAGWSGDKIKTAATRSQRSGFLSADSAWGGLIFHVTDMLLDLAQTVDFEDALKVEGIRSP